MSEYTPTTNEVREDFAYPWEGFKQNREGRLAAFDRWLAINNLTVEANTLREAADLRHGTDLTPTVMGNPDPIWWYGYLQRVDDSWRHQLRARADQIEGEIA